MLTELAAETLLPLSIQERKVLILNHALLIDVTHIADEDLHTAYKYGKIISSIAPAYLIIPEFEFGIKIKGIDIVILAEETIKFAQLKTLKGTLTGSQTNRAKKELGIYDNPLLIAAFNLGDWTFNDKKIPRIAGKEFWNEIYIDYDLVETHVRNMLQRIDKDFGELATS